MPTPQKPIKHLSNAPRLRIVHLMLWTACAASLIALGELSAPTGLPEEMVLAFRLRIALMSIWSGLAVAGTITLLAQATRGSDTSFRYSGHWLLCRYAVVACGTALATMLARIGAEGLYFLPGLAGAAILLAALFAVSNSGIWKVYLAYAAACQVANSVLYAALTYEWFSPAEELLKGFSLLSAASSLGSVLLLVIAMQEWRRGLLRNWLHTAGIATVLGSAATGWVLQLVTAVLVN